MKALSNAPVRSLWQLHCPTSGQLRQRNACEARPNDATCCHVANPRKVCYLFLFLAQSKAVATEGVIHPCYYWHPAICCIAKLQMMETYKRQRPKAHDLWPSKQSPRALRNGHVWLTYDRVLVNFTHTLTYIYSFLPVLHYANVVCIRSLQSGLPLCLDPQFQSIYAIYPISGLSGPSWFLQVQPLTSSCATGSTFFYLCSVAPVSWGIQVPAEMTESGDYGSFHSSNEVRSGTRGNFVKIRKFLPMFYVFIPMF